MLSSCVQCTVIISSLISSINFISRNQWNQSKKKGLLFLLDWWNDWIGRNWRAARFVDELRSSIAAIVSYVVGPQLFLSIQSLPSIFYFTSFFNQITLLPFLSENWRMPHNQQQVNDWRKKRKKNKRNCGAEWKRNWIVCLAASIKEINFF